ncbi:MAG: hypothetical protein HY809_01280 [Nitrospirae bacterium]|nr:hypothetical protein [Nitrospirota bacterium]
MKSLAKKLENIFSAVAFAESGEFETAVRMIGEEPALIRRVQSIKNEVDLSITNLTMMALSFAEDGEYEKALEIMKEVEIRLEALKEELRNEVISLSELSAQT